MGQIALPADPAPHFLIGHKPVLQAGCKRESLVRRLFILRQISGSFRRIVGRFAFCHSRADFIPDFNSVKGDIAVCQKLSFGGIHVNRRLFYLFPYLFKSGVYLRCFACLFAFLQLYKTLCKFPYPIFGHLYSQLFFLVKTYGTPPFKQTKLCRFCQKIYKLFGGIVERYPGNLAVHLFKGNDFLIPGKGRPVNHARNGIIRMVHMPVIPPVRV